jgi:TatD DNase family protein
MPIFYDTHAHLDDPKFRADLPQILERAAAVGITKVISIGTDLESSRHAVTLADEHSGVFAVVGWHPSHAHEAPEDIRSALRGLAQHPKVVALGETGLDYHWLPSRTGGGSAAEDDLHKQKQASLFRQHLEVAVETGLNLVIHQRESFDDIVSQLRPYVGKVRAVFHCFGENTGRLRQVLDLGCLVSFTGIVSFKNAQAVRETVAATPQGSFMLETDSPYLAPMPYRGKRCEPAYIKEISELVAQVRCCSREVLSEMTCVTAEGFFPKLRSRQAA